MTDVLDALREGLGDLAAAAPALLAAAVVGWLGYRLLFRFLRSVTARTDTDVDDALVRHAAGPSRVLFPVLAVNFVLPAADAPAPVESVAGHVLAVLLILSLAWLAVAGLRAGQEVVLARFDVGVRDNLRARKVHTQVDIVRKILTVIVAVLAFSAVFLHFDSLRRLGTGILASAGLAGLVLGLAAQRTLSNLLAGFQLALTQPIRIDDVLVVEGEWGRVEEITLTYVVVRIWDKRRLVLPITYFLEKPFQNWTRTTAGILGTVFLYVDYRVPVDEVRRKLGELVEASEHWDGEVWRLHVTDSRERTLELRAMMSAPDAPAAWELRCEVREKLVSWLQEAYPEALPRVRAELEGSEGWPATRGGSVGGDEEGTGRSG